MKKHQEFARETEEKDNLKRKVTQLESTIEILSQEIKTRQNQAKNDEKSLKTLQNENNTLTEHILKIKLKQAEDLTKLNEHYDTIARERMALSAAGGAGSENKRNRKDRKISADVDYTNSDSILESSAFQEVCNPNRPNNPDNPNNPSGE